MKRLLAAVISMLPIMSFAQDQERFVDYVDPYIGSIGWGNVGVGPTCPFGMVKPAPACTDGHGPG